MIPDPALVKLGSKYSSLYNGQRLPLECRGWKSKS